MPVGDEHHRQVISTLDTSVLSCGILSLERIRVQSCECNQRRDVRVRREPRSAVLRASAERGRRAATTLSAVEEPLHGAFLTPKPSPFGKTSIRGSLARPRAACVGGPTIGEVDRSANFQFKTLGAFFTNGEFFLENLYSRAVSRSWPLNLWPVLVFYEASGGSAVRSVKRHVQRSEIDCVRACDWRSSEGAY